MAKRKFAKAGQVSKSVMGTRRRSGVSSGGPVVVADVFQGPVVASGASVLEQVAKAKREQVDAESRLGRLVAEARSKGSTWQEVGAALGVSPQGARQRFGAAAAPKARASRSAGGGSGVLDS